VRKFQLMLLNESAGFWRVIFQAQKLMKSERREQHCLLTQFGRKLNVPGTIWRSNQPRPWILRAHVEPSLGTKGVSIGVVPKSLICWCSLRAFRATPSVLQSAMTSYPPLMRHHKPRHQRIFRSAGLPNPKGSFSSFLGTGGVERQTDQRDEFSVGPGRAITIGADTDAAC
jgi:hypothetical protein